jgi:hypothetical protein
MVVQADASFNPYRMEQPVPMTSENWRQKIPS